MQQPQLDAQLLDPIDEDDPVLLSFNVEGRAIPAAHLTDAWEKARVEYSVERYNLVFPPLMDKRKVVWDAVAIIFGLRRKHFCGVLDCESVQGRSWPESVPDIEIMETLTAENQITVKTKELCQAILDEPNMRSIRQRIDAFMGDEKSRTQYDGLVAKGQALQQKQQMSLPLTNDEIVDFEKTRDNLLTNPVARDFLDAQEELHNVQESIHQYVTKTLELGRLPTEADMNGGGCGHGCGCNH